MWFSRCPAVKTSAEQKRIKFPERKPTSNPVIPLTERTCAGPTRPLSVRKQKFPGPQGPVSHHVQQSCDKGLWPLPLTYAVFIP